MNTPPSNENRPTLTQVLEQIRNLHGLTQEEWEWLWSQRQQAMISTRWIPSHTPTSGDLEDFSAIIKDSHPIVFGPYYALYPIGAGGLCVVYKAWQLGTENFVALKRLLPENLSEYGKERFHREVALLKELQHPNILPLLDGGTFQGDYFLVTPLISDGALADRIRHLPRQRTWYDLAPLIAIILQIGKALAYAHQKGVIHRDVKPENILLQKDHPYLGDFGLARKIDQKVSITRGAVGTPAYMAPELWKCEATPQCDIYSLSVILYEIITGTYPFSGSYPEDILASQLSTRPRPPVQPFMSLPRDFNTLILKGLSISPKQRYASMDEFVHCLVKILEQYLARE